MLKTKTRRGQSRDTMPSSGRHQMRFWIRKMTASSMVNMGRKPGLRKFYYGHPGVLFSWTGSTWQALLGVRQAAGTIADPQCVRSPRGRFERCWEYPPLWNSNVQNRKWWVKKLHLKHHRSRFAAVLICSSAAWKDEESDCTRTRFGFDVG